MNYKVKHSGAGPFTQGQVFSADQAKDAGVGHLIGHWTRTGGIEETAEDPTPEAAGLGGAFPARPVPPNADGRPKTDEQNKLEIEEAIKAETLARGPLTADEKSEIAARITHANRGPGAPETAGTDAARRQNEANAAAGGPVAADLSGGRPAATRTVTGPNFLPPDKADGGPEAEDAAARTAKADKGKGK